MYINFSLAKGIRYREHPARKHGVHRAMYYVLCFVVDGKTYQEALGWASGPSTQARSLFLILFIFLMRISNSETVVCDIIQNLSGIFYKATSMLNVVLGNRLFEFAA